MTRRWSFSLPAKNRDSVPSGAPPPAAMSAGRVPADPLAPQIKPHAESKDWRLIQFECAWGSISNAGAGMGRFVPDCYGVSPWAIYVRPGSKIRKPADLKDVPVSVGMRAGSHFNVPYRLEKHLPLEHIRTVNTGGFGARLKALFDGGVEGASLLPPQIDTAD